MPRELADTFKRLVDNEVPPHIARKLLLKVNEDLTGEQLADSAARYSYLENVIAQCIRVAGPIATEGKGSKVVVFIGPTGVGKTTTIAKLAADFKLRGGKRIGLITADTYRIAAVEQLRKYAQIMDVPLEVVLPGELARAVDRSRQLDIVLVDTAGRSQRDDLKMNQLRQLLASVKPHEVHLVLSATCSHRVLGNVLDRFGCFDVDKIVLTKLDEAAAYGGVLDILSKVDKGLSYVTTGQDVPDDIEVADAGHIARLILGGHDLDDR